jgi:hypothetical protein
MTNVITPDQARQITGGHIPLIPVEYEEACKRLVACQTLDEAKYWDNKADALAAWAKIYHNDQAGREARALKLWAYRRMGELAAELRPHRHMGTKPGEQVGKHGRGGSTPGPFSLLKEQGLTESQASAARRLARVPLETVKELVELPRPPSPGTVLRDMPGKPDQYHPNRFGTHPQWTGTWGPLKHAIAAVDKVSARELARSVEPRFASRVRERLSVLIDWLDEFEQAMPKANK